MLSGASSGRIAVVVPAEAADQGTLLLSVNRLRAAGLMTSPHRDPFERLLAAQAVINGPTLVTADPKVQAPAKEWLW